MLTSTDLEKSRHDQIEPGRENCDSKTCRLGACPPCLFVWGIVAVFLIGKALLEMLT